MNPSDRGPDPVTVRGFRHLEDRPVHHGHIWDVVVATFEDPGGGRFERDIVRSPGAVGVVPVVERHDGELAVVLLAQYRPALGGVSVEIPAGMRDVAGEATVDTARRELTEEVGLVADRVDPLIEIVATPGMSDQLVTLFLATGCERVERAPQGPEELDSEVLEPSLAEAIDWIHTGRIRDAKSVIALLLAERRFADAIPR